LMDYAHSGAYEYCTSILRDMYYIYAAEYKRVPYWPQTTRIEFAKNFPNYLERGVRSKLYHRLATELGTAVRNIEEVFGEKIMFIPPFSAIVLDRCKSVSEVPEAILEIRKDFMWLREDMKNLENEMQEAKSFRKMQKVANKQKKLSEAIAGQFGRSNYINIEKGIKFIPELMKPALSPMDPTKYSAMLLLQPIEWIMEAVRNRPVAYFFELKAKVDSISGYSGLVRKLFQDDNSFLDTSGLRWLIEPGRTD
jgi:hypothetical protein